MLFFFFPNSSLMHGGQDFPCLMSVFLYPLLASEARILNFRVAQLHYGETQNIPNRSTTNPVVHTPQQAEYVSVTPQNETPEAT